MKDLSTNDVRAAHILHQAKIVHEAIDLAGKSVISILKWSADITNSGFIEVKTAHRDIDVMMAILDSIEPYTICNPDAECLSVKVVYTDAGDDDYAMLKTGASIYMLPEQYAIEDMLTNIGMSSKESECVALEYALSQLWTMTLRKKDPRRKGWK